MPLFIDCYNVLHETMPPSMAGLEEGKLCRLLASSPWAGDRIVVVCDGVVKPLGLEKSPVDEVELIYSGGNRTADDVIVEMVQADTAPKRVLVVSSDREIQKAVKRRKAKVWSSAKFIRELAGALTRGGVDRRHGIGGAGDKGLSKKEVDLWLDEFGVDQGELGEIDGGDDEDVEVWPPEVD